MSRLIAIIITLSLIFFSEVACAQNESLPIKCDELCNDAISFVTDFIGSTVDDHEWFNKNVSILADTTSYSIVIGEGADTTLFTNMIVSNGRILELSQKVSGQLVGLNISEGKISSFNPFMFESFRGYSRYITHPIKCERVIFWSGILPDNEYFKIDCL